LFMISIIASPRKRFGALDGARRYAAVRRRTLGLAGTARCRRRADMLGMIHPALSGLASSSLLSRLRLRGRQAEPPPLATRWRRCSRVGGFGRFWGRR
jgi:hypothetical protein